MSFLVLLAAATVSPVSFAHADAAEGDVIITLGEDLSEQQREEILNEMEAPDKPEIVTVTNEEEHQYLGNYISKAQIGSRALSSSKITVGKQGSGLIIETRNINWVTKEMYANALTTAGVKDADIYITAPFEVSGTAALTGIIKAYEISADVTITEQQKQVANEEMVTTAELGDKVGADKAAELMTNIKEKIAENKPETDAEMRTLIENAAKELGITLSDAELDSLVDLFNKMKELDIDWNQVSAQLEKAKENFKNFMESEEGQSILEKLKRFFSNVIDALSALFR
nr:DUF1002 domain-containing protein [Bacillus marinisedimentorum]